ncbi:MAG: hypothetical protein M1828_002631 [Chrysothrix sp. TS-e1954]|nr:MAG: hypothetical protein M1828_002631 [Chrysothrix sp. TS-e1954]
MSVNSDVLDTNPVYSIDATISDFFTSHTTATQADCDERATLLLSASTKPIPIQGSFSYTVVGGCPARLVQFRTPESDIDMSLIRAARSIHGDLVANTVHHGLIGHSQPLSVYVIEKLPGITYMESCFRDSISTALSPERFQRQRNTIMGFARLFAASWKFPQSIDAGSIQATFAEKLQSLQKDLPARFSDILRELSSNLASVFSERHPAVLTHGDLCEMNFLVDPDTGHLTGVIDWAEAEFLPFGCALWGLENILGYMDLHGWHYFEGYQGLEELFWRTFEDSVGKSLEENWRAISVARKIGILFRYGYRWDQALQQRIIGESDPGMKYLDAFILGILK